jgi:hypothetical protein
MTDHPDPVEPDDQSEQTGHVELTEQPKPSRRRVRRRAERPGTNPSADDAPDVVPPRAEPKPGESQHDRWLREQRPPHWE